MIAIQTIVGNIDPTLFVVPPLVADQMHSVVKLVKIMQNANTKEFTR